MWSAQWASSCNTIPFVRYRRGSVMDWPRSDSLKNAVRAPFPGRRRGTRSRVSSGNRACHHRVPTTRSTNRAQASRPGSGLDGSGNSAR